MAQNVLSHLGTIVPRRTFRPLTETELTKPVEIKKRDDFDKIITRLLGDSLQLPKPDLTPLNLELHDFSDDSTDESSTPVKLGR